MRLSLVYHGRIPGEKAASIFAVESAHAFAQILNTQNGTGNYAVDLIIPKRRGTLKEDVWKYYGLTENFNIVRLPCVDLFGIIPNKIAFHLCLTTFSAALIWHFVWQKLGKDDVVYSNETLPLMAASLMSRRTFFEMHDFLEGKRFFFKLFFSRVKWILIHNRWKVEHFTKVFGRKENILYEPNAVSLEDFDIKMDKDEARNILGLDKSKKYIVYTGHLFKWKGVDTLAESARLLPKDFEVLFIGGMDPDLARCKSLYGNIPNVRFLGHQPHTAIPTWQKAADVLVLPNTAKEAISKFYTSPMKLFEYMASKRPIVATNIPSLTEIISDKEAVIVEPDDAKDLARGLIEATQNGSKTSSLSDSAFARVTKHTWHSRAQRIIDFIKSHE